ncbi:MAG: hypothetical protein ACI9G1_001103 [Pirellulaceae bacterium]|jgi:hypothetical protein
MGTMRFHLPDDHSLSPEELQSAYLAGHDAIPWRCQSYSQDDQLVIQRPNSDFAHLHIPWQTREHGKLTLTTTSLPENEQAHRLALELARGTLNRLRNQSASWQHLGLLLPDRFHQIRRDATRQFIEAGAQQDSAKATDASNGCISSCLNAIDILIDQYSEQVLRLRHEGTPQLQTLLGCNLTDVTPPSNFKDAFNTAAVSVAWRDVEIDAGQRNWDKYDAQIQWCQDQKLRVCAGPLLQLDEKTLPDWIYLWEDDFYSLQSFVIQYVQATVRRYSGKVHIWNCAGRMNLAGSIKLTEEQMLRLTVSAIETIRRIDSKTPVIVSFDQPFAEYLSHSTSDLSPLHFADALARAQLGLSGIGLELNYGYSPNGSSARDFLEISRLIDRFSQLGLPLVIYLLAASNTQQHLASPMRGQPTAGGFLGKASEAGQADFVERMISLLLCKQSIYGLIWNQYSDIEPHGYPHSGLFNTQNEPKPAVESLIQIRNQHVM